MQVHQRYTDVKNGKITPSEFLQEAKWDPILSKYITNFDTFESAVNVFKTKGLLFEESESKNKPFSVSDWRNENSAFLDTKKGDVDSAHVNLFEFEKGWRWELKLSGKCDEEAVQKAKAKAVKNLEKDAIHYTKLEMGELAPDDKNTQSVDVSKGQNKVDEKNAAKPVKVKDQDSDASAKAYLKAAEEKGKAPKKVQLNEGLKLPTSIVNKIEQAKDWISKKTEQDKEKPKYKAALKKLEDVLATDAEGIVKTLRDNIKKVSPDFPNQKSGEDFRARLNDIYVVYDSLNKANLLDEKDEDYLPSAIANPIIEALRAYVAFLRDNELSTAYKYLKEDTTVTAGANGLTSLLQKVTDINLGASQPVTNLEDAIKQVGGGDLNKGLENIKGLFQGNGAGSPDQQIDALKGLIEKGAVQGEKLADIFDKAGKTFGSAKDGQKLFSIASPNKEMIISKLEKVADTVSPDSTSDVADTVSKVPFNILEPLGIAVAVGTALWTAAQLKRANDSRSADLNKLYSKLKPLTDREEGDSVPQDKQDAEDKEAPKADNKKANEKGGDEISKPIELDPNVPDDFEMPKTGDKAQGKEGDKEAPEDKTTSAKKDTKKAKSAEKHHVVDMATKKTVKIFDTPEEALDDAEKLNNGKKATNDSGYKVFSEKEVAKKGFGTDDGIDDEEQPAAAKEKKTKKSVKATPLTKDSFKNNPEAKVVGITLTSDVDGETNKFKSVKFGLDPKVYDAYKTAKDAKLRNSLALIASKVKSTTTELSVDLTGMLAKEIEAASKGDVKITKTGKLKEEVEIMWESSELDNMIQSHANSKNPLVTEDCGCGEDPKNKVPGGLGDKLTAADVDADELAMGLTIEREHTDDPEVAMEIALDHLAEDPHYYSKMKESGLEEGVKPKRPYRTNWPFYAVQAEKALLAGFDTKEEASNFLRDNAGKGISVKTREQVSLIGKKPGKQDKIAYYDKPESWRNIGYNKFMWDFSQREAREELMEVLRGMVKKNLLKEYSFMPKPEGPDVDRKELKNLLAGIDWPPEDKLDEDYDNSYRDQINQEKIMKMRELIDRMGQEGIDLYNEYAPEGCKWGQEAELFNMKEEAENMIHQQINDMQDMDPKDLAKEVLEKGFPEHSIKNKAAALILGNAIKEGEKDPEVKKAFMMLSDKLKKK